MQCPGHVGQLKNLVERRRRIVERREHLDISDELAAASQRAHRRGPGRSRAHQAVHHRLREVHGPAEGHARNRCSQVREGPADRRLDGRVKAWNRPDRAGGDFRSQIGRGGHSQRLMQLCELFNRHRTRLEQPPEIGGEIGDGRLEENPSARFVHVAKARQRRGAGVGRRVTQERPQVPIGFNLPGADERGGFGTQRRFALVAANGRYRRELVERPGQRGRRDCAGSLGFDR
jgi:hypothetical protein